MKTYLKRNKEALMLILILLLHSHLNYWFAMWGWFK